METPGRNEIIEYSFDDMQYNPIFIGYSCGERGRYGRNRLKYGTYKINDDVCMTGYCDCWRYPGETDWRR